MATKRKASSEVATERRVRRKISDGPKHGISAANIFVGLGPSSRASHGHNLILEKHSEFFKIELAKALNERKPFSVVMPHDDPDAFEIFFCFIYTGRIFCTWDDDFQVSNKFPGANGTDVEWQRLQNAWLIGDKLRSTSFKDAIVDAMIPKVMDTGASPVEMHQHLYPKSSAASPIRKLLVDIAICGWSGDTMQTRKQISASTTFFFDVAVAMDKIKVSGRQKEAPYSKENTCSYHEHGEHNPCYKTMFS